MSTKFSISVKRRVLFKLNAWITQARKKNVVSNISKSTNAESKIKFGKSTTTVSPFKKRTSKEN